MKQIARPLIVLALSLAALIAVSALPAAAQYAIARPEQAAIGEAYHVEFSAGFWNPTPDITFSSESLGLIGTDISAVDDLGVTKGRIGEFRLVLRPATKHKFRFDYLPVKYEAETTLSRSIVFNGQRYDVNLPVNSSLKWEMLRVGYEYDFVYRNRGYVGFLLQTKLTRAEAKLDSPIDNEFAQAWVPIPEIGGVARVYAAKNFSITGEVTYFKLPESVDQQRRYYARNVDFDIYGTFNFTNNVGAQVGYRSIDMSYRYENDYGALKLPGLYFAGVARF